MRQYLLLASACLCGQACRYNGTACPDERLLRLKELGLVLAVCPEEMGGLSTPRSPCERRHGRVFGETGIDVTEAFEAGAAKVLALAREHGIRLAVMKERSPSCGVTQIYDGSFSGRRIPGQGVTTQLLQAHGITVFSEESAQLERVILDTPHPA